MPGPEGRVARASRQPPGALRPDGPDLEVRPRPARDRGRRSDVMRSLRPARLFIVGAGFKPAYRITANRAALPATGPRPPPPAKFPRSIPHEASSFPPARRSASLAVALALIASAPLADLGRQGDPGRRAASLADRAGPLEPTARGCWSPTRPPDSVSLVDTAAGRVLAETPTGAKPAGVALSPDGRRGVVTPLVRLRPGRARRRLRPARGRRPRRGRPRAPGGRDLPRRPDGLRRRGGEQRGGARRPRRADRSRAASPSAASRAGWRSRPTARACWSATPDRRT